MQWFWLSASEQRYNNWVLYKEATSMRPVHLRARYERFTCPECRKIDEDAALRSGIDNVRLRAKTDLLLTSDNVLCFSEKLRDIFVSHHVMGLEFLEILGQSRYQVVLPTHLVEVDLSKTTFQYEDRDAYGREVTPGFCATCGRPRLGRYLFPTLASLVLPEDPLVVVAPAIPSESPQGKVYWILVSEVVKGIMRENRVSGAGYAEPY